MPKKHILQVVQHLQPGGIETMALDLMTKADPSTEVHIVSLEGNRETCLEKWKRLQPLAHRLHFLEKKPGLDISALVALIKLIDRLKFDVVHTHHIGPLIYGGTAARIAGARRLIHTEHDAWHLSNKKRRLVQSVIAKIIRPVFVADADMVAGALKRAIPMIKPLVIHNGIDTDRFTPGDKTAARKSLGLPVGVQIIGCAARLEAVKGHHYLISAMSDMPEAVHLALAGNGSLRDELEQLAVSHGLENRIHFLGAIDDMPAFHRAQDVFCLASEKEGLPLSPLEAQASGAPVVLTDVGGCKEAVCPTTGTLVEARSATALSAGLNTALNQIAKGDPRQFVYQNRNLDQTIAAYEALH